MSTVDNVEYVLVDNPPAGTYRLKVLPYNAPGFALPYDLIPSKDREFDPV